MAIVLCCLFEATFLLKYYVELDFRKNKLLLNCSYNVKCCNIESYLNCLSKSIDLLPSKYENIILLGDFNSCKDYSPVIAFCET